jgi:hypothetical protein
MALETLGLGRPWKPIRSSLSRISLAARSPPRAIPKRPPKLLKTASIIAECRPGTVWQKVLIALWNERVTKDEIANQLHIPVEEIENLLFGLTGTHVEENAMTLRPPLRLV